jgi:hypothetical protein
MSAAQDHVPQHRVRHINPVQARLLQLLGPADSWDSPLAGTKYDPATRQHEQLERRQAKQARKARRRHEHEVHRMENNAAESDHHTPDEV